MFSTSRKKKIKDHIHFDDRTKYNKSLWKKKLLYVIEFVLLFLLPNYYLLPILYLMNHMKYLVRLKINFPTEMH